MAQTAAMMMEGAHTITVAASGYAPETITVSIAPPQGCCGTGEQKRQTVDLAPAS